METITQTIENLDAEIAFAIKEVNKERKANKGKWYSIALTISGKQVFIGKAFGTWVQRMSVEGENSYRSSSMDISVKDFNEYLEGNFLSIQGR